MLSTPLRAPKNRSGCAQTVCRFRGQELHSKVHDTLVVHSQRKQFISYWHRGVAAAWVAKLLSTSLRAARYRSGCAQTACRFPGQELHSKVHDTIVVQSRHKPFTSYTHGVVTAAWKSDLYSTPKCAAKGRSGSAQTTCQFHCQELHSKVHGALMAHSQARKCISSGRAGVSVAGKVELSTRPRWPSQSQNRFASHVSTPSPGAGHKTNRQPRCASEAHAAHMIYAWMWIGAQSQHGRATQASASRQKRTTKSEWHQHRCAQPA